MNTSIHGLQTQGFATVPYPEELKQAVSEAEKCWQAFCNLPEETKRSFSYSNNGAGVGYEDKRVSGNSSDLKENFDLSVGDSDWLHEQADIISDETVSSFIQAAIKVATLLTPSITSFAADVESEFGVDNFESEVRESANAYFVRFIHYFEGATLSQETAEAHTDQSGMTPHLFESAPGLECLTHDMMWVPMPVSEGSMVIIPSMQLQLRSKGTLKATVHRVVATPETIQSGRYSAVCFVQFKDTPKYDKSKGGRLQQAQKKDLGFNYRMSHEEFAKLFK